MADINQLIEPVTPSNTVNSINIYKVDYLPNVYVNPRKIKGRKYDDKYVLTDPKIGQLKIKQFVSSTLKSHWGLVSKAVKIKNTVSLNTENDKYMFIKNASKEDLKKIKYDNYFGIRVSNTDLYDFDRRMIYHDIQRDPNENDVVIIDKNNAEPMIDLSKYKNVFIDKNNFKPILRYFIKDNYDEDIPEFIGKQQDGVTGSMILPNNGVTGSIILPDTLTNQNQQGVNQGQQGVNQGQQGVNQGQQSVNQGQQGVNQNSETLSERLSESDEEETEYKEEIGYREILYPERKALYKEQSKVEKDLKNTIVRYVDKYVNFAAANELNNIEDIDYIIDAFNEYAQEKNIKINKRSIDAVNRRVSKLYEIRGQLDSISMIRKPRYIDEDSESL